MGMKKKKTYADWHWHLIGTTLVLIATDAFERYQKATGGVFDQDTHFLKITSAQYENLKSIFIHVKGVCVSSSVSHWQCGEMIPFPSSPGSIRINP